MAYLYALFDFELNQKYGWSIEEFVLKCKQLDAKIIQYRDKVNSLKTKREVLSKLRDIWDRTLIINDKIELVDLADGVHLGQEDISKISIDKNRAIDILRDKIGNKIIGLSTHDKDEILEANSLSIDYIGLGAYRNTSTKKDAKVLQIDIKKLSELSVHDVAIIGGVKISDDIDFAKYKVVGSDIYIYN